MQLQRAGGVIRWNVVFQLPCIILQDLTIKKWMCKLFNACKYYVCQLELDMPQYKKSLPSVVKSSGTAPIV